MLVITDKLDPKVHDVDIKSIVAVSEWRRELRFYLCEKRNYTCDQCGASLKRTGFDLHEALVTRADTRGVSWQPLIFSEFNCLVLCPECHRTNTPSRWQAKMILCKHYDLETIENWYNSLPWKSKKETKNGKQMA